MKKCSLFSALLIFAAFTACKDEDLPVMGNHSVLEVDISELSGLCLNRDVKTVSFDGKTAPLWSFDSDMEGITIDPASGNLYIAIEGRQEVHMLAASDYDAQVLLFPVSEAVEGNYRNNGIDLEDLQDRFQIINSQPCSDSRR